jgi:hypothetical protein
VTGAQGTQGTSGATILGNTNTWTGTNTFNYTHGMSTAFGLPAGNNGAGTGNAYLYLWTSEPAVSWTAAGIARNKSNTGSSFARPNTGLSGQMIRFDEGNSIIFSVTSSGGTDYNPFNCTDGYAYSNGSLRAPIFYDTNNTVYYTDPASTSNLVGLTVGNTITGSISGNAATATTAANSTLFGGYAIGRVLKSIGPASSTNWNTLGDVSQTVVQVNQADFGSNSPTVAYQYGALINFDANSDAQAQVYVSHAGNDLAFRGGWRASGASQWQTWNRVLTNQNFTTWAPSLTGSGASGSWGISVTGNAANITAYTINQSVGTGNNVTFNIADATQFRDSNDTSYYLNPNGDSSLSTAKFWGNQITIRGGSPTLHFQDADQMSAMLHNNSNLFYILRGGVDTTSWSQVGGYWPVYWDLSNNNATFGGAIWAAGNVTAYSDAKLKENVETVTSALDKTLALRGVYYTLIRDETKTRKMGVIAQEVQKVVPEVVMLHQDKEDAEGTLSVDYGNITALLIEAIKEQQKQIDELKALIKK